MIPRVSAAVLLLSASGLLGCGTTSKAGESAAEAVEPAAAEQAQVASEPVQAEPAVFGEPAAEAPKAVALAELLSDGAQYEGASISTSGEVARVCERMGCWMELKDPEAGNLRVPMAGHAFFVPQSIIGQKATVEGKVVVKKLSEEQIAHYRSEGMEATAQAVSLHATAVRVAAK